jgi:hypothetical protein
MDIIAWGPSLSLLPRLYGRPVAAVGPFWRAPCPKRPVPLVRHQKSPDVPLEPTLSPDRRAQRRVKGGNPASAGRGAGGVAPLTRPSTAVPFPCRPKGGAAAPKEARRLWRLRFSPPKAARWVFLEVHRNESPTYRKTIGILIIGRCTVSAWLWCTVSAWGGVPFQRG